MDTVDGLEYLGLAIANTGECSRSAKEIKKSNIKDGNETCETCRLR